MISGPKPGSNIVSDDFAVTNFQFTQGGFDTDGDGIPNHCDLDSDNDGISDLVESGQDASVVDMDGDGVHDGPVDPTTGIPLAANGGAGVDPVDSDMDGVDDFLDLDSDNDGIADAVEAQPTVGYQSPSIATDTDGDGVVDTFDSTTGHGGNFSTPVDTDMDGTADFLDTDSDGDGASDAAESGLTPGADNNGDGIADNIAPLSYADTDGVIDSLTNAPIDALTNQDTDATEVDFRSVNDKDGDGVADFEDLDSDNDGILDTEESLGTLPDGTLISDVVGTGVVVDASAWNSVLTSLPPSQVTIESFESFSANDDLNTISPDGFDINVVRNSGTANGTDYDVDGREYSTDPLTGNLQATFDVPDDTEVEITLTFDQPIVGFGFNIGDLHDAGRDSELRIEFDGQTVWHSIENFGFNNTGIVTNLISGEMAPAGNQSFLFLGHYDLANPTNEVKITVTADNADNIVIDDISIIRPFADTDGDGIGDHCDLDSDNDGISDLYESQAMARDADTNSDGNVSEAESLAWLQANVTGFTGTSGDANDDGLMDIFDENYNTNLAAGEFGTTPVDTDGDGVQDYLDLDSDNDRISDTVEARPTAGYTTNDADTDVDGVTNNDADGDGIIDQFDSNDGGTGVFGGSFVTLENTDGSSPTSDTTPDYLDADSDNDGISDTVESGLTSDDVDADGDGIADDLGASYVDPDGDVDVPINDLTNNTDNDTSDVDYRSLNDKDWDGVPDHEDLDVDGDGILNIDEAEFVSVDRLGTCLLYTSDAADE